MLFFGYNISKWSGMFKFQLFNQRKEKKNAKRTKNRKDTENVNFGWKELHIDRAPGCDCDHSYMITLGFKILLAYSCLFFRNVFLVFRKSCCGFLNLSDQISEWRRCSIWRSFMEEHSQIIWTAECDLTNVQGSIPVRGATLSVIFRSRSHRPDFLRPSFGVDFQWFS